MPKQKIPKGALKDASSTSEVNDPRFSNFSTDPRFRLPSKKQTRTKIDKRFSRMLKDDDFSNSAKVDRYGRKLSGSGKKKALERLYVDEDEEDEDSASENEDKEGEDVEVEDDEVVEKELRKAAAGYDPARGGGFSSSEDEDEDEDEDGGVDIEEEATFPDMQAEQQAVEMGEVSSRIAVVNLDWDNIRSVDLMAVFQSFVKPGGKIHKISIYQSEYGKERMEREELEGPPKEIFAKNQEEEDEEEDSEDDEDTDDEELEEKIKKDLQKGDDGNEFDSGALRQYQLERLRYFYAVVVCSDEKTAENIYQNCDGTEYLSSANFFDLRFIPDGTEFDDKPRDECKEVPTGYKPTDFVTDALQHSKVKLTWDMNPEEASRKDAINRAFTGSRADIGENDLRAYLGSDSEDDEEEEEAAEEDTPKLSKKELERQKLRAALGLGNEPTKKKKDSGPVGDMEITFTAGLTTTAKGNVFENEPIPNETTAEAYIRKEKERKARRKEKAKAVREGRDPNASDDEEKEEEAKEDLGFDDPFFATDEATKSKAAKSLRKEERKKKHEAKIKEAEEKASNRAELELLMQDNSTDKAEHLDHFDIAEIQRAEKAKKKGKGKGKGKKGEEASESKRGGLQENFQMDVGDERFGDVFKNHEYAIDPSNPKFKGTEGMKKLLEEGRRKRGGEDDGEMEVKAKNKKRKTEGEKSGKADLSSLVEAVRKKSKLAK
ncbi:pre-rRNA-processing protein esf1 [Ciborinia camelliae]|nr:pre-rRNA-processing protein esf1 [Ciborinia camelliae]